MLSKNSVLSKIQRPGTVKYSPRKYDAIQTLATLGIYLVGFTKTQIQSAINNLAAHKKYADALSIRRQLPAPRRNAPERDVPTSSEYR